MTHEEYKDKKLNEALAQGDGLVYLHQRPSGQRLVVMTLDRFQREMGGFDPGHDDAFPHQHLESVTL